MNGINYTTLVFGNGPNRVSTRATQNSATVMGDDYLQEAGVRMGVGSETHGGGDVLLFAAGAGAQSFKGTMNRPRCSPSSEMHLISNSFARID